MKDLSTLRRGRWYEEKGKEERKKGRESLETSIYILVWCEYARKWAVNRAMLMMIVTDWEKTWWWSLWKLFQPRLPGENVFTRCEVNSYSAKGAQDMNGMMMIIIEKDSWMTIEMNENDQWRCDFVWYWWWWWWWWWLENDEWDNWWFFRLTSLNKEQLIQTGKASIWLTWMRLRVQIPNFKSLAIDCSYLVNWCMQVYVLGVCICYRKG